MYEELRHENTLNYLKSFSKIEVIESDYDIINGLYESLAIDGHICQSSARNLSDILTASDPQFVTYIILVMVCIICAAGANGLTQVSFTI